MFNRISAKALAAGLLMAVTATLAAQSPADVESGFIRNFSPICPTEQDLRAVWEFALRADMDGFIDASTEHGCTMYEQDMMYGTKDEGRIDDFAAKVSGVWLVDGEVVSFKGYTAPAGMLCVLNCPPRAIMYHDHR